MPSRRPYLWLALVAFVLAVIVVGPVRVTTLDDDWAYTLTVKGILEHRGYHLNDWAAANMPFQAYLGALFSNIGGFSPTTLRHVNIFLALFGLIAFYNLARESDLEPKAAGVLTLILVSSPLFLRFSLNFMTDVPFLAMLVATLWLYARAVRTRSVLMMLLGSIACAAAILTRQFGMAALGALFMVWLTGRDYRRRPLFFLAGMVAPAIASAWQLWWGTANPTWGESYAKFAQSLYMGDAVVFIGNMIWRPAAIILYMGLFALPLAVVALLGIFRRDWMRSAEGDRPSRPYIPWLIVVALCTVVALIVGHLLAGSPILMPSLPWNFELLRRGGKPGMLALTLVTGIAGVLVTAAAISSYFGGSRWREIPVALRLLAITSIILLLMHLVFFKIGDEYLLVFLPFMLIAAGRTLRPLLDRCAVPVAVAAIIVLAISTLQVRGLLESEDASWRAAELALARGGTPATVSGSWNWDCYHGAFDDYLKMINHAPRKNFDEFFAWYRSRRDSSRYVVAASPRAQHDPDAWAVRDSVPYTSFLFGRRYVYLLEKTN